MFAYGMSDSGLFRLVWDQDFVSSNLTIPIEIIRDHSSVG